MRYINHKAVYSKISNTNSNKFIKYLLMFLTNLDNVRIELVETNKWFHIKLYVLKRDTTVIQRSWIRKVFYKVLQ